jgi:hypothetical protein
MSTSGIARVRLLPGGSFAAVLATLVLSCAVTAA